MVQWRVSWNNYAPKRMVEAAGSCRRVCSGMVNSKMGWRVVESIEQSNGIAVHSLNG